MAHIALVQDFPCVTEEDLRKAMGKLHGNTSTVLVVHAEIEKGPSPRDISQSDPTLYTTFLESRPQKLETDAISLITTLQSEFPSLRCHIVHLSASAALPIIREAKRAGLKLTVETCFHYLFLASEDIPRGRPEFKCCPPIREQINREALWDALKDGTIDFVVSDHSPCSVEMKKMEEGDFMSAWAGISTLGLGLSLLWTEGRKRGIALGKILEWTSVGPAKLAGLGDRKGRLKVGADADIVFWNPDVEFEVRVALRASRLLS
jgi:allantoinase